MASKMWASFTLSVCSWISKNKFFLSLVLERNLDQVSLVRCVRQFGPSLEPQRS